MVKFNLSKNQQKTSLLEMANHFTGQHQLPG